MIDPNISLAVRTPQVENPLEQYGKALSIRSMIQNQQLGSERLKTEQDARMEREQQMADMKVLRASQAANKGDIDAVLKDPNVVGQISPALHLKLQETANQTKEQLGKLDEQKQKKLEFQMQQSAASAQRMLNTPPNKQATAWAIESQRLKDAGIDSAHIPTEYPGDEAMNADKLHGMGVQKWLDELRAGKKAEEDSAKAARDAELGKSLLSEAQMKERAASRAEASSSLSSATDAADYANKYNALDPAIAGLFHSPANFRQGESQDFAMRRGATSGQLLTAETREQAERDRVQARKDYLAVRREGFDLRRELAAQSEALRRDLADGKTGHGQLTGNALKAEEARISALEDGTPSRPGLNRLRINLGKLLIPRKDANGKPIYDTTDSKNKPIYDSNGTLTRAGQDVKDQLDAATDSLQATQYRKAKLYGVQSPDPEDVKTAKDGDQLQGLDGSTWHKQNGVAFFKSMGDGPGTGPPAPAPAPNPPPTSKPSNSAPKYTEAEVRARAKAKGVNEAEAVQAAKAKGLI